MARVPIFFQHKGIPTIKLRTNNLFQDLIAVDLQAHFTIGIRRDFVELEFRLEIPTNGSPDVISLDLGAFVWIILGVVNTIWAIPLSGLPNNLNSTL